MNRTIPVCLLTLLATGAIPLATHATELRLGVQGGANNATLSVTNPEPWGRYSARTRPLFGGALELRLGQRLSVALEPSFVGKGGRYVEYGHTHHFNLDYVELPLYAKYRLTRGGVRPYLGAGVFMGFPRAAEANGEDIKNELRDTDAGVAFGAGVELVSGNTAFFVDSRYAVGLTNISNSADDPETEARNRGVQIRAGVMFRLGRS